MFRFSSEPVRVQRIGPGPFPTSASIEGGGNAKEELQDTNRTVRKGSSVVRLICRSVGEIGSIGSVVFVLLNATHENGSLQNRLGTKISIAQTDRFSLRNFLFRRCTG